MEIFSQLIDYMINSGGFFGFLLALSFIYIGFREYSLSKIDTNKIEKIHILLERIIEKNKLDMTILEKNKLDTSLLDNINKIKSDIESIKTYSKDIYDWHNVRDSDGYFVWYFKNSFLDNIKTVDEQLNDIIDLLKINTNSDDKMQKVNDKRVSELKSLLENYNKTIIELTLALEKIKIILKDEDSDGK